MRDHRPTVDVLFRRGGAASHETIVTQRRSDRPLVGLSPRSERPVASVVRAPEHLSTACEKWQLHDAVVLIDSSPGTGGGTVPEIDHRTAYAPQG
jgi:hypothetical protein